MDKAASFIAMECQSLRDAVDEVMRAEFAGYACHPGGCGRSAQHGLLWRELEEFVLRPGKRFRPLLFLQGCAALETGARPDDLNLLKIAAALEYLHAFILIHDDVIDQSGMRRGLPCLHQRMEQRLIQHAGRERTGANLAIVMGDVLFAIAQHVLVSAHFPAVLRTEILGMVLDALIDTGEGEAADVVYGTRDVGRVGLEEIEEMYLLKTTRYTFELPLLAAATVTGQPPGVVEDLRRISRPIGLAFQIRNDLAEFAASDPSNLAASADIAEGKKTLLLRTAYELLGETDRALMQLCLSTCPPTEAIFSRLRDLIARSGAPVRLAARIEEELGKTDEAIGNSRLGALSKERFRAIFAFFGQTLGKGG